jgi:sRNA-binding carbon storage regulator CsrA
MLVLSRFELQRIFIGKAGDVLDKPIEIVVLNSFARVGIDARRDIEVVRDDAKKRPEQEPAACEHCGEAGCDGVDCVDTELCEEPAGDGSQAEAVRVD